MSVCGSHDAGQPIEAPRLGDSARSGKSRPQGTAAVTYDLRFEPWIPYRRASGAVEWLPPYAITDRIGVDPIVALASPRSDFDLAVTEFLIGLLSVALGPENETEWGAHWKAPPTPSTLRSALAALPDAFALDGDGPRAFQDVDPLADIEATPIESLLINSPGAQSTTNNTDLFVKRQRNLKFGRPAAAMALLTMQTFAPAGGQGHRTSMRGGGPLVTLVEPRLRPNEEPLWRMVWANTETVAQLNERDGDNTRDWTPRDRFPWLAATRTSNPKNRGGPTYPADASPVQAYFGLPRRIRLDIEAGPCICDLTGHGDSACVTGFRMKNYGVQYLGWVHPLTPYYHDKKVGLLPRHGQPGGVGWRDWQGLLFADAAESGSRPARAVARFRAERACGAFRLIAAGYDMDNMKARYWVQAELPAFPEKALERIRQFSGRVTEATEQVGGLVVLAVKSAQIERPKDAAGDYRHLRHTLWADTQAAFFAMVADLAQHDGAEGPDLRERFRRHLRGAALAIFDRACPLEVSGGAHMRRPIAARHGLVMALEGYSKAGKALFNVLGLSPPVVTGAGKGRPHDRR